MSGSGKVWARRPWLLLGALSLTALMAGALVRAGSGAGSTKAMLRGVAEAISMYDTDGDRAQCLANVKLITGAFRLYLADNDGRLPPKESEAARKDCEMVTNANPYLRWPVIVDQYVSPAAWDCPTSRVSGGAQWIVPGPDWQRNLRKDGERSKRARISGLCTGAWPGGWGGSVTDSAKQGKMAIAGGPPKGTGAFRQGIGHSESYGLARASVPDPAWYVVCGDSGKGLIGSPVALAYPDVCKAGKGPGDDIDGCDADWVNCPSTKTCGLTEQARRQFWADASFRRQYARHLGGSNIGYLDGHAGWTSAEGILSKSPTSKDKNGGRLRGIHCLCLGDPGDEDETESEGEE